MSSMEVVIFYFLCLCHIWEVVAQSCDCNIDKKFDYIVVGAGTTGSVVAARLSEMKNASILVLEAGDEPIPVSNIPFLSRELLTTNMNWNYKTKPQKHCCKMQQQQTLPIISGRSLGGTSSLDFMLYTRGNRKDFDQWHATGNDGWSHRQLLPYFRKIENYRVPQTADQEEYHSEGGPITIQRPCFRSQMSDVFLRAGHQLGHHLVDVNGRVQTGFMTPPLFLRDGERCSSYTAYLEPAMKRSNLRLITNVRVSKIVIENKRAVGVEFRRGENTCLVKVKREIILSAGVFNTPQILMLSGVGPAKILNKHRIKILNNLPGVGQNLQDHLTVNGLTFNINQSATYNYNRFWDADNLDLWRKTKTGPLTSSGSYEGIAFYKSKYANSSEDWPDIEILFKSDNMLEHDTAKMPSYFTGYIPEDSSDVVTFYPILLRPKSRGSVAITSLDPMDPPEIDPNYLSHPNDIKVLLEGWKFVWEIARSSSFRKYGAKIFNSGIFPLCLQHVYSKNDYALCAIRSMAFTMHNPVGTCKMGHAKDPKAVVDSQLRVRGILGLRIADASVMPSIVSGHSRTACVVIGEKLAALIRNDTS